MIHPSRCPQWRPDQIRPSRDHGDARRGSYTMQWDTIGETRISGTYLAVWRRRTGQWFLECELFVTLS